MSSRLQLNVGNLSLGRRHLVNAYEVKAGTGVIAGNTVIHAWAPCVWYINEHYINSLPLPINAIIMRAGVNYRVLGCKMWDMMQGFSAG